MLRQSPKDVSLSEAREDHEQVTSRAGTRLVIDSIAQGPERVGSELHRQRPRGANALLRSSSCELLAEKGFFFGPHGHFANVLGRARRIRLCSPARGTTRSGLGAKSERNRNFELGIVTEDEAMLDDVQSLYQHLWTGGECARCGRRALCEAPLA